MISPRHLEGIAREIIEKTGVFPPIDAFELATACGFVCRPWGRGGGSIDLAKREIRYNGGARNVHQHGIVSHELGHFAVQRGGEDMRDEDAARYMAGALMLPFGPFRADCYRLGFDLEALREIHRNASAQMACVRMTQVSDVSTSIWDSGHLKAAYGPGDPGVGRELVDLVLGSGEAVRGEVAAFPIFDRAFRRVVVIDRRAA